MTSASKKILLGRITAAHGIRGEVIVRSFAQDPASIAAYGSLSDKDDGRTFVLRIVRATPKGVVCRIDGVATRNEAEALKGIDLYVSRDKLPEASGDEFYITDLIGLAAVSPDGEAIGQIIGVENFGAGDLIDIRLTAQPMSELVAFTKQTVPDIDIAAGRVVVVMPVAAPDDEDESGGASS